MPRVCEASSAGTWSSDRSVIAAAACPVLLHVGAPYVTCVTEDRPSAMRAVNVRGASCHRNSRKARSASAWAAGCPKLAQMRLLVAISLGCLSLSCASDPLLERAGADLRCDQDQLRVKQITEQSKEVDGCGQRATYIKTCPSCEWVMSPPDGAAPP